MERCQNRGIDDIVTVLVLLLAGLVMAAVVAAVVVAAVAIKRNAGQANQVVPGHATRAPESWAGSHEPEAVLHRRVRDAMVALRSNQTFDDDGGLLDLRVELEVQAVALDDRLVSVAALPRLHRGGPLADATQAVDLIETAVAELTTRSAKDAEPALRAVLDRIRERNGLLGEIQAELDRLPDHQVATEPGAAQAPAAGQTGPVPPGSPGPPATQPAPGETQPGSF